ncbi:hypothetical protein IHC92_21070 [Photobacterium damselae subsp. damselae]|uniref:hypothetical protein n=1 Tax=Photobacterium damselae TaxID=38293 RepID=UPI001F2D56C3|nr:hypothetical protein [Photobacterium damselae]UJZ95871.1 hypothetical protein IHC87_20785 [Photobacterium damselae subsp. damselae]UKA00224.1 hypothetical protein IHC88_16730 [Photobacterium damselae subsp. damselae]UKA08221.1 hypothetical protein IHC90_20385 [Photobacterium damselae subsp. damselae]UKA23446.1 hypothetical protein IHC92_21070 [Photobacterium damselae subsp. damselae]
MNALTDTQKKTVTSSKPKKKTNSNEEKKISARIRIEQIREQQEWDKEWGI